MAVKLALMCKDGSGLRQVMSTGWAVLSSELDSISLAPKDNGVWETEAWVINEGKLVGLIGNDLILTKGQNEPAYIGGEIKSFRKNGKRVSITFKENPSLRGFNGHVGVWKGSNPVHYLS